MPTTPDCPKRSAISDLNARGCGTYELSLVAGLDLSLTFDGDDRTALYGAGGALREELRLVRVASDALVVDRKLGIGGKGIVKGGIEVVLRLGFQDARQVGRCPGRERREDDVDRHERDGGSIRCAVGDGTPFVRGTLYMRPKGTQLFRSNKRCHGLEPASRHADEAMQVGGGPS